MYPSSFSSSLPIFALLLLSSSSIVVDALKFIDPHPGNKQVDSMFFKTSPPDLQLPCGKTMAEIGGPIVMISKPYWDEIAAQVPDASNPVCDTTRAQVTTEFGGQIATIGTYFDLCEGCPVTQIHMIYQQDNPEQARYLFGEQAQSVQNATWTFMGNREETTTAKPTRSTLWTVITLSPLPLPTTE